MYITKLKKDEGIKLRGNIIIKVLSTGEASTRIAVIDDTNQRAVLETMSFEREPTKNVANL